MCCCRINTDVLLANLFAKKTNRNGVTIQILVSYLNFLAEHFPVYVTSDLCEERVSACTKRYKDLYYSTGSGDSLTIFSRDLTPNLKYFNSIYNKVVADYIERMTESFVKQFGDKA